MRMQNTYKNLRYIVGIDEAGRGPLAGPVAVGAFCVKVESNKGARANTYTSGIPEVKILKRAFKGARDSKKMTAGKREKIFEKMQKYAARKALYIVHMESAKAIDTKGISFAIRKAIKKCLDKLGVNPKQTLVLLDGGIKAPAEFIYQKTIIKGDDKEIVISLASISAKVTRDAHMKKLAKKYPQYGLELHKGYGTLRHRTAIRKNGPSAIHRKTYLKNI